MAKPYLAPSLVKLRSEVDTKWPNRSKAYDGWIGDAAHQARKSEHNPDDKGEVHAIDITSKDIDADAVLKAVIGDDRVWYVIHKGIIYSRTYGWAARKYTGANRHDHHIHVSIRLNSTAEKDTSNWLSGSAPASTGGTVYYKVGSKGDKVKIIQTFLKVTADGIYGPKTEKAVKDFQMSMDIRATGSVGIKTLAALKKKGAKDL